MAQRFWLLQNKVRFLLTPWENRIRLEIERDGRQLTYLIVSLHALGYAIYIVESPMLYRELQNLKNSAPVPFIFGGKQQECSIVMSDRRIVVEKAKTEGMRAIYLDNDYFSPETKEFRMPYFMHPSVYHNGWDKMSMPPFEEERAIRIGFFGTRDAAFYSRDFNFPILNREEILEMLFSEFSDKITTAKLPVEEWNSHQIIVSIDGRGGDHDEKSFLHQHAYLKALRRCDFILSPPGWCMPLSHNLIEAMNAGCIPIINSADYVNPKLEHGKECFSYSTRDELDTAIETALAMPLTEIRGMRHNVVKYFNENLRPGGWLKKLIDSEEDSILVNAEEISLGISN